MRHDQLCFLIALFFFFILQSRRQLADGGGSQVPFLPGFQGPLPFELETGYIGVDEEENVQLFYYFVKSGSDPQKDPLLLWLTGGPGCSVLSGLIYEIGPISFKFEEAYDGTLPKLALNPYSWTEVASILFVDLPVGTGFSYAKIQEATSSTGLQSCHQAYQFLQKGMNLMGDAISTPEFGKDSLSDNWLNDHPEFISNPFYVGGDSYIGITLPVIVQMISNGNEMGIKPWINLKGYLLGNAMTFPDEDNYKIPYAHGMGLISDELYQSLKQNCRGEYKKINSSNLPCMQDVQTFHQLVGEVNDAQILEPKCPFYSPRLPKLSQERRFLDEEQHRDSEQLAAYKCHTDRYKLAPPWANDPGVQEALHIRKGTIKTWKRCNRSLPYTDNLWDSTPYHAYLSTKGYRSLIYSGDHDMAVTFLSTQAWIRSLNYPIVDEWRPWLVQNQVAGYTRTYANRMTFATIKGGGHTAPEYNPMECAAMFKRWMSCQPL